ncbi:MAG: hypothetical protein IPH28_19995 [Cytophagaceae bacterium]|nr:hypothetical protein [Cytophagaceae bacterium]
MPISVCQALINKLNIGINDQLIGTATEDPKKSDTINYDLILNPLDLSNPPNIYNYTVAITVSEY